MRSIHKIEQKTNIIKYGTNIGADVPKGGISQTKMQLKSGGESLFCALYWHSYVHDSANKQPIDILCNPCTLQHLRHKIFRAEDVFRYVLRDSLAIAVNCLAGLAAGTLIALPASPVAC